MPIPKPFQRPSISVGCVQREWQDKKAALVKPGENVHGVGVVATVTPTWNDQVKMVNAITGESKTFHMDTVLRVFGDLDYPGPIV